MNRGPFSTAAPEIMAVDQRHGRVSLPKEPGSDCGLAWHKGGTVKQYTVSPERLFTLGNPPKTRIFVDSPFWKETAEWPYRDPQDSPWTFAGVFHETSAHNSDPCFEGFSAFESFTPPQIEIFRTCNVSGANTLWPTEAICICGPEEEE